MYMYYYAHIETFRRDTNFFSSLPPAACATARVTGTRVGTRHDFSRCLRKWLEQYGPKSRDSLETCENNSEQQPHNLHFQSVCIHYPNLRSYRLGLVPRHRPFWRDNFTGIRPSNQFSTVPHPFFFRFLPLSAIIFANVHLVAVAHLVAV